MQTVNVTVKIPLELAEEAHEFDLLSGPRLVTLLRDEVDRRAMELVNQEVQAYRSEKAAGRAEPD